MTKIEWTEATWSPIVGCSIVSPGCTHCYAMIMARRLEATGLPQYQGLTKVVNGNVVWTGKLALAPEKTLLEPLRRRKPTMWFVNSMSDLFHEDVPDEWIDRVFAVMALCPQHTFQVLTKRSARMRSYFTKLIDMGPYDTTRGTMLKWTIDTVAQEVSSKRAASLKMPLVPLPKVWLGVSCERQQEADERIPDLLATPAAVRFVSAEPLLGPIDFKKWLLHGTCNKCRQIVIGTRRHGGGIEHYDCNYLAAPLTNLNWIIAGGESGPGARPMHPDWARSIRDQCAKAGVPFFFKQWGEWLPTTDPRTIGYADGSAHRGNPEQRDIGASVPVWRVGKSRAGRLLDGREHNDMPRPAHA